MKGGPIGNSYKSRNALTGAIVHVADQRTMKKPWNLLENLPSGKSLQIRDERKNKSIALTARKLDHGCTAGGTDQARRILPGGTYRNDTRFSAMQDFTSEAILL